MNVRAMAPGTAIARPEVKAWQEREVSGCFGMSVTFSAQQERSPAARAGHQGSHARIRGKAGLVAGGCPAPPGALAGLACPQPPPGAPQETGELQPATPSAKSRPRELLTVTSTSPGLVCPEPGTMVRHTADTDGCHPRAPAPALLLLPAVQLKSLRESAGEGLS